MMMRYFKSGLDLAVERRGLALVIYLIDLGMALLLAAGATAWIAPLVADTGFGDDMADQFDLLLWADLIAANPGGIATLLAHALWVLPLLVVWKTAVGVGLIHALRDGGVRSFWAGVGQHTPRALVLSGLYVITTLGALVLCVVAALVLNLAGGGEVYGFWINFVVVPTVVISAFSILDMMHDYSRMYLVIQNRPVTEAWLSGMAFPFRFGSASRLYLLWFVIGLAAWCIPTISEWTLGAVLAIFVVQQIALLLRAGITVGWIGSEVVLFEDKESPPAIA